MTYLGGYTATNAVRTSVVASSAPLHSPPALQKMHHLLVLLRPRADAILPRLLQRLGRVVLKLRLAVFGHCKAAAVYIISRMGETLKQASRSCFDT